MSLVSTFYKIYDFDLSIIYLNTCLGDQFFQRLIKCDKLFTINLRHYHKSIVSFETVLYFILRDLVKLNFNRY